MRLLVTGASGRLGNALKACLDEDRQVSSIVWLAPSSKELDVTDPAAVLAAVERLEPDVIVHAAAFTDVAGAEQSRAACWNVNVEGTRNIARAAQQVGARLVHISTDYVFWGGKDRPEDGYRETDLVGPVRNYYALTKLLAEEAARRAHKALIVRTSFRSSTWPNPLAYDDLYTSQDYVDVIAQQLVVLLRYVHQISDTVLHVATERKSVFELVQRRTPMVERGSRLEAPVPLPEDVSLNTDRWSSLTTAWSS